MTIDLEKLKTLSTQELQDLAIQVGAPYHHMHKQHTLIENIVNHVMKQALNSSNPKPEAKPEVAKESDKVQAVEVKKDAPVFLTEEELEKALEPIKARSPSFGTSYDHECRCVTLRYNDGRHRHAETMSLSCSKTKFLRKAAEIAKGPLLPRALRKEDFGGYHSNTPHSAYTETVLAG